MLSSSISDNLVLVAYKNTLYRVYHGIFSSRVVRRSGYFSLSFFTLLIATYSKHHSWFSSCQSRLGKQYYNILVKCQMTSLVMKCKAQSSK